MGKDRNSSSSTRRAPKNHIAVSPCLLAVRRSLKQRKLSNPSGSVRLATCSLGYARAHPLIWEFCRTRGVMIAGGIEENNKKRRVMLTEGSQILVHAPASQNGTGVLGIGWITSGCSPPFAPGVPDDGNDAAVKDTILEIKQKLKDVYANPENRFVSWRPCDRKGESTGEQELKVARYSWDFGQQWARGHLFKTCQNRRYFHFKVQWEATVPWNAGIGFKSIGLVTPLSEVAFRWTDPKQRAQLLARLSGGCNISSMRPELGSDCDSAATVSSVAQKGGGEHVVPNAQQESEIQASSAGLEAKSNADGSKTSNGSGQCGAGNVKHESEIFRKLKILKRAFDQNLVTSAVYEQKQIQILEGL